MKQIIHTFTQLFTMSASLMGLVVLFLFMWTVVGHRLFGERYIQYACTCTCVCDNNRKICKFHLDHRLDVDRHVGLPNFDNLFSSFLLVFQVSVCTMDRTVTNLMLFLCTLTSAL